MAPVRLRYGGGQGVAVMVEVVPSGVQPFASSLGPWPHVFGGGTEE